MVGLRYFNVYGPGEAHKGGMASVIHHFREQLKSGDEIRLFAGSDGYGDGEQVRDFIHVDDIVAVNLWAWRHGAKSGIYNLGTGQARSFNDVARAVLKWHGRGRIQYIPFPEHLKGSYQSYTQADLSGLRAAGYARRSSPSKTACRVTSTPSPEDRPDVTATLIIGPAWVGDMVMAQSLFQLLRAAGARHGHRRGGPALVGAARRPDARGAARNTAGRRPRRVRAWARGVRWAGRCAGRATTGRSSCPGPSSRRWCPGSPAYRCARASPPSCAACC